MGEQGEFGFLVVDLWTLLESNPRVMANVRYLIPSVDDMTMTSLDMAPLLTYVYFAFEPHLARFTCPYTMKGSK